MFNAKFYTSFIKNKKSTVNHLYQTLSMTPMNTFQVQLIGNDF